jgi:hypothetical protein
MQLLVHSFTKMSVNYSVYSYNCLSFIFQISLPFLHFKFSKYWNSPDCSVSYQQSYILPTPSLIQQGDNAFTSFHCEVYGYDIISIPTDKCLIYAKGPGEVFARHPLRPSGYRKPHHQTRLQTASNPLRWISTHPSLEKLKWFRVKE